MIDLRDCKPGDKLLSKHGLLLTYVRALPEGHYMDHEVKYPNISPYHGGTGARTHDGFVMRKARLEEDHDIVEILKEIKVMSTEKSIQQLQNDIVANYVEQIAILRSIVASDQRIIEVYKAKDESSDKYIAVLKEQVFELQQQAIRVL